MCGRWARPLAGVLAIATADIAVLAKLYAEAIENAEKRQAEESTRLAATACCARASGCCRKCCR